MTHAEFRELLNNRIEENDIKCQESKYIGNINIARLHNHACVELESLKLQFNKFPDVAAELDKWADNTQYNGLILVDSLKDKLKELSK